MSNGEDTLAYWLRESGRGAWLGIFTSAEIILIDASIEIWKRGTRPLSAADAQALKIIRQASLSLRVGEGEK